MYASTTVQPIYELLFIAFLLVVPIALVVQTVVLVKKSRGDTAISELGPAPAIRASRWADRWVFRWVSAGGAVSLAGIANLLAALNWGSSSFDDASQGIAGPDANSLWGFALLIIGQQMVTRRAFAQHRDDTGSSV